MDDVHAAIRAAGMLTNPSGTERLHQYWVHGEGAAKIRWGEPNDFSRCVEHLGKFLKNPKGYCNLAHHAALGFYPATHAAMEHKVGRVAMADTSTSTSGGGVARSTIIRPYPLEECRILRSADGQEYGSGRVVEAYAAVFDDPVEIRDRQGHYEEIIDRAAFDRTLTRLSRARGGLAGAVRVLYNHGRTMGGAEAPEFQRPIGKPLEVRPEGKGLLTRTEYNNSPLAEEILENIKAGSITGQSFEGPDFESSPALRPGDKYRARNGVLPKVRRMILGLTNYGPALYGAYPGAEFLGVVRMNFLGAGEEPEPYGLDEEPAADDEASGTGGAPEDAASARYHQHALYRLQSQEARERIGLTW